MYTQDLDLKLTTIKPEYSDKPLLGHFKLTFGLSKAEYDLAFPSFIKYKYEKDEKLKQYIRNLDTEDIYTCSDIIKEFYSLGLPVEDWVEEYIEDVKRRMTAFSALIRLFQHLKTFGDDERTI
jgi:hypothetical protein